ncbi:hypothetical protein M5K25_001427 [Dendrobium thyrsiflorum]|uniref:Uncharacterized protein n=1 Tax=Dendrobium thyrsiflorum TaxID=117978 RepID=A0ABD0VQ22_DENTH
MPELHNLFVTGFQSGKFLGCSPSISKIYISPIFSSKFRQPPGVPSPHGEVEEGTCPFSSTQPNQINCEEYGRANKPQKWSLMSSIHLARSTRRPRTSGDCINFRTSFQAFDLLIWIIYIIHENMLKLPPPKSKDFTYRIDYNIRPYHRSYIFKIIVYLTTTTIYLLMITVINFCFSLLLQQEATGGRWEREPETRFLAWVAIAGDGREVQFGRVCLPEEVVGRRQRAVLGRVGRRRRTGSVWTVGLIVSKKTKTPKSQNTTKTL